MARMLLSRQATTLAAPQRRTWPYWLTALLVVVVLGLNVQYLFKVWPSDTRSAILRWREHIQDLGRGVDIWETDAYPNPPIMALLLTPLAYLPPLACSLLWFYLKVGLLLLGSHWIFRGMETGDRPFPPLAKVMSVLICLKPIVGDLTHGNINLFILFLVLASLRAHGRRKELAAGLVLALAIACKVTPALFVPYFLWKRAWRTLAGCGLGLALFLWLIPGLVLGMENNQRYFNSWLNLMVRPFVVDGEVTPDHVNQSLPGLVYRLASHRPSFSTYEGLNRIPVEYHNLIDLDGQTLRWTLKGFMGLFALAVIWTCRTPRSTREKWRHWAEFSIVVLGMLLFSERTWKHHCVTLLLPFSVIFYYLFTCRPGRKMKWYLIATVAAVVVLLLATGTGLGGDLNRLGKLAQVYGTYVWAYLLLIAAMMVLLRHPDLDEKNHPVSNTG